MRWVIALSLVFSVSFASAEQLVKLTLGVHPYKSAQKLYYSFLPLTDYLSEKLGRPVRLEVSKDYKTHVRLIGTDQLDIAYMGPVPYVTLRNDYSPKRVVAQQLVAGKTVYHGHIFVTRHSQIQNVTELKGKRFAFVDPGSTMGHIMPRQRMLEAGVKLGDLDDYEFLGSRDNVALGVLSGDFDAGSIRDHEFHIYEDRGLRILATSECVPNHVFVVGDHVPDELLEQLRVLFYTLAETPEGLEVVQAIAPVITGMVPMSGNPFRVVQEIIEKINEAKSHKNP